MKPLIIAIATIVLMSSCIGGRTKPREVPDYTMTLYKRVSANANVVKLPLLVYDMGVDKTGHLVRPYKFITVNKEFNLPERLKDLDTEFCFRYSYSVKTRGIGETEERPMEECDQGIIIGRLSFVGFLIFIRDFLYNLYKKAKEKMGFEELA